ncbi:hypothetical protein AGLY_010436 [Aphis glycines]|uniref:Uncharacterized protein n=1 Tax=Aphis glycines TaxID=307491 RepID=A0A6G0TEW3_APHGL|nr:hypothetical protein AGLY_010436 [Aphis glycines]
MSIRGLARRRHCFYALFAAALLSFVPFGRPHSRLYSIDTLSPPTSVSRVVCRVYTLSHLLYGAFSFLISNVFLAIPILINRKNREKNQNIPSDSSFYDIVANSHIKPCRPPRLHEYLVLKFAKHAKYNVLLDVNLIKYGQMVFISNPKEDLMGTNRILMSDFNLVTSYLLGFLDNSMGNNVFYTIY